MFLAQAVPELVELVEKDELPEIVMMEDGDRNRLRVIHSRYGDIRLSVYSSDTRQSATFTLHGPSGGGFFRPLTRAVFVLLMYVMAREGQRGK